MNRTLSCTALFSLVVFAGPLVAAQKPARLQRVTPEEAMLARVALKYQSLSSLSHRVHGTMKIDAGGAKFTAKFKARTHMARAKQFRAESEVEFFGSVAQGVAVTDGKTFWDFDPIANEYSERRYDEVTKEGGQKADWLMDRVGLDFPLMLFLDASKSPMLKIKPGAEKAIEIKKFPVKMLDGAPVHLVNIPVPSNGGKPGSAVLYVGSKDMMIRRCRMSLREKAENGQTIGVDFVCFYTDIKPNSDSPLDTFTFSAPTDAKKVESVAPAFDRAFNRSEE